MTCWPFILKFEHPNKYWVGLYEKPTRDINRIYEAAQLQGCQPWVKKYGNPTSFTQDAIGSKDKFLTYLIKIMAKYGIENVRGGPFITFMLDDSQTELINRMVNFTQDLCIICGTKYHLSVECPNFEEDDIDFEFSDIEDEENDQESDN